MTTQGSTKGPAVLFSAGLDSAVLLAVAVRENPGTTIQPIYVNAGLAWEAEELAAGRRLLGSGIYGEQVLELTVLAVDMRDVYPPTHWAVRGEPPAYDTPDEDVYIEGRNIVLLSKTAIWMARRGITRVLLGPLGGNPFPDATPQFFSAMAGALSTGLAAPLSIETPFAKMDKSDVIRLGREMRVPFELTVSCMQSRGGVHCGRCSKCRERVDAFKKAGVSDPTVYAKHC
jgi:7-cyano-7-deazaguanine synthase